MLADSSAVYKSRRPSLLLNGRKIFPPTHAAFQNSLRAAPAFLFHSAMTFTSHTVATCTFKAKRFLGTDIHTSLTLALQPAPSASEMKLSVRGEYALRALLVLGLHYDEPLVRIQAISDEQNIPKRFLEQILNDLKSAGLVRSKRGVAGGYRLARRPEQISVASVVRHIEGALAPVRCVSDRFYEKCSCPDESRCAIRHVMKEVRDAVVKIAERITIADLCERSRRLHREPMNVLDFVI